MAVLVDGQHFYHETRERHGRRYHVALVALELAGPHELVTVRYHDGIHDVERNKRQHARAERQHKLLTRCGVEVHTHPISYRPAHPVSSPVQDGAPGGPAVPAGAVRAPDVNAALVFDAFECALWYACDRVIVIGKGVSLRRLHSVLQPCTGADAELAVFRGDEGLPPIHGWSRTHYLRHEALESCVDEFDYTRELPPGQTRALIGQVQHRRGGRRA